MNRADLAIKIARMVDFCGKLCGFADFETGTVDRGSAVIFDTDSGLGLSYVRILRPKRNLDHRSFFNLCPNYFFIRRKHLNSGVRLLLELYCAIKHVAFFTTWVKINGGIHMCQFTFEP